METGLAQQAPPKEAARFQRATSIFGLTPFKTETKGVDNSEQNRLDKSVQAGDGKAAEYKPSWPYHLMLVKLSTG